MKFNLTKLIPAGALLCIALASCKKNDAVTSPSSQLDQAQMRSTNSVDLGADELTADVSDAVESNSTTATDVAACATVTYVPSKDVYPHIKTVDFGSGCTDENGKTKTGKRITTVYADWKTAPAGTLISVTTMSNYTVNGISVAGSAKTYIQSPFSPGPLSLKTVASKTFVDQQGNTSTYIGSHNSLLIVGGNTDEKQDDVYSITGASQGTELSGNVTMAVWRAVVEDTNPVIKNQQCSYRSQGKVDIHITDNGRGVNEVLDYGNGACDDQATLTVANQAPLTVSLPFVLYTTHL